MFNAKHKGFRWYGGTGRSRGRGRFRGQLGRGSGLPLEVLDPSDREPEQQRPVLVGV